MAEKKKAAAKKPAKKVEAPEEVEQAGPIGPFEGSTVQFNPSTGAGVTLPAGCTLEWVEHTVHKAKIVKLNK